MTRQSFIAVAKSESIPERGFSCHLVGDIAVVICRVKAEYFALENRCSHALSTFDEGRMRGYQILCPMHGAAFDIRDGSAASLPAKTAIRTFPVRVKDGMIEVGMAETQGD